VHPYLAPGINLGDGVLSRALTVDEVRGDHEWETTARGKRPTSCVYFRSSIDRSFVQVHTVVRRAIGMSFGERQGDRLSESEG